MASNFSLRQPPDDTKPVEHFISMRGILQFIREVLTSPVFIMFAAQPKARSCHVVDHAVKSNPDFRLVLTVSQRKLRFCDYWKIVLRNQVKSFGILRVSL